MERKTADWHRAEAKRIRNEANQKEGEAGRLGLKSESKRNEERAAYKRNDFQAARQFKREADQLSLRENDLLRQAHDKRDEANRHDQAADFLDKRDKK